MADDETLTFTAPLWRWSAREGTSEPGSWCFVTVPEAQSEQIRDLAPPAPRGFGSVRVAVTCGPTTWRTSVFPDAASGCFALPVKKAVRVVERVSEGDELTLTLRVLG